MSKPVSPAEAPHTGVSVATSTDGTPDTAAARVNAILADFLDDHVAALIAISPDLAAMADAARAAVFAGGKRMRPRFALAGWASVHAPGAADEDAAVRAAASLELLHAAALVHDDLIDDSATRRGQPAAHVGFASLHGRTWPGDATQFGAAAAVLLGDLLLAWAGSLLAQAGLDTAATERAARVFDTMSAEMMAGQYLDVLAQTRGGHSVEAALRVARFKTGKYTVERPLHFGAAAAGAPADVLESLSAFGLPLGEAFQLRDDLLGVFGDPAVTGKPAGDDLREGKRTVLIALAHQAADADGRAALDAGLGQATLDVAGVEHLRGIVLRTGAAAEVERMIDERVGAARHALDHAIIRPEARRLLASLAAAATRRDT